MFLFSFLKVVKSLIRFSNKSIVFVFCCNCSRLYTVPALSSRSSCSIVSMFVGSAHTFFVHITFFAILFLLGIALFFFYFLLLLLVVC